MPTPEQSFLFPEVAEQLHTLLSASPLLLPYFKLLLNSLLRANFIKHKYCIKNSLILSISFSHSFMSRKVWKKYMLMNIIIRERRTFHLRNIVSHFISYCVIIRVRYLLGSRRRGISKFTKVSWNRVWMIIYLPWK